MWRPALPFDERIERLLFGRGLVDDDVVIIVGADFLDLEMVGIVEADRPGRDQLGRPRQIGIDLLLVGRIVVRIDIAQHGLVIPEHLVWHLFDLDLEMRIRGRFELRADDAAGLDRDLERPAIEVSVDRFLDVPEHILHLLAVAGDLFPLGERPVLDHRCEEELARALEQERELFDLDVAIEVRALDRTLELLDRGIARDVLLEPLERLVLVVLDQHFAIEVVELLKRARERQRATHFPAALRNAREIAERRIERRHLVEPEVADDEVVDVIGERELRDRALGPEEHALLAERTEVSDLAARDIEHRARRVDRDQPRPIRHPAKDLDRGPAGAARDIEHLSAVRHREISQQHLAEARAPHGRDFFVVDARELLDLETALLLDRHGRLPCCNDTDSDGDVHKQHPGAYHRRIASLSSARRHATAVMIATAVTRRTVAGLPVVGPTACAGRKARYLPA